LSVDQCHSVSDSQAEATSNASVTHVARSDARSSRQAISTTVVNKQRIYWTHISKIFLTIKTPCWGRRATATSEKKLKARGKGGNDVVFYFHRTLNNYFGCFTLFKY